MDAQLSTDTGELVVRGRRPFAMIPTELVRDPEISSSAVRLWTVLASYAYGSDVVTRPSRAALAGDCGYGSTRAVDLNLRQLARAGWLTIEPTRRADGGRGNNRYILEWEPRGSRTSSESAEDSTPNPTPPTADPDVCAGQPPARIIAPGSPTSDPTGIPAGQAPAKLSAPGYMASTPLVNIIARGPAKNIAPLRERKQPKKPLPPPAVGGCTVGAEPAGGLVVGNPAITPEPVVDSAAAAALAATIRAALPSPLARQLGAGVLRDRCAALAAAHWTSDQVAAATRARSWTGAGPGAVVRWVSDLATETPPTVGPVDRQAAVRRQLAARREQQDAMDAAAGAGPSEARRQALRLAAELAARSRSRRAAPADRAPEIDHHSTAPTAGQRDATA